MVAGPFDAGLTGARRNRWFARWRPGWIGAEIAGQEDRWFAWLAVAFALGIGVYFSLPVEPPWLLAAVAALGAAAGFWRVARSPRRHPYAVVLMAALAGFACAKLKAELVAPVVLPATTGTVVVTGEVVEADLARSGRRRMVVAVHEIAGIKPEYWPRRIRLTLPKSVAALAPGTRFSIRARLFVLPVPVEPAGYDFARALWFEGIGATGVGFGEVQVSGTAAETTLAQRVHWLRQAIVERLHAALPADRAGIAAALIVGERSGIPEKVKDNLQIAGLAHILAISGLHMTLVAGGMFWAVRAFLALFEGLALGWPIKKWAAGAALLAGAGYLVISGSGLATQRAFIMLAIMLLAIVFGRPAISMRNLAIAALAILIFEPQALLSAGFQMSFLAVMGLIAAYEHLALRRLSRPARAWPEGRASRAVRMATLVLAGMAMTTLVASVMTAIPAVYHFNRPALWSLPANLLALPVVTFVVMPAATVAGLLMPLGLERLPLAAMGWGIGHVTAVADWTAAMPGAGMLMRQPSWTATVSLAAAAIWLCLWHGALRWLGAVPAVLAVLLAGAGQVPDILFEAQARNAAIRNVDGELVPANARRGKFAVERWLARDGDAARLADAASRSGWTCDAAACTAAVKGRQIVYALDEKLPAKYCEKTTILLASQPLKRSCAKVPLRIDRFDVWREGSQALFIGEDGVTRVTAASARGRRPWVVMPIARRHIRTADNPLPDYDADPATRRQHTGSGLNSAGSARSGGPEP